MKTISIITVVLNSRNTIRDCIESVISQKYPLIEHIIIDGGSSDGTQEIITDYFDKITIFISKKDNGIYDALNEGITLARGEVIGVLHSDDVFCDENTLSRVMERFNSSEIEALYGDLIFVSEHNPNKTVRYWKAGKYDYRKFYHGWMPPHPATFIVKNAYDKFGLYNLELGTSADYELMLRFMVVGRIKVKYINKILVYMRTGGVSNKSAANRIKANIMDRKAWAVNGLKPYFWTIFMKPAGKIVQYFRKCPKP